MEMCGLFTCIPILGVFIFLKKEKEVLRDEVVGFTIKLSQTYQYHTTPVLLF